MVIKMDHIGIKQTKFTLLIVLIICIFRLTIVFLVVFLQRWNISLHKISLKFQYLNLFDTWNEIKRRFYIEDKYWIVNELSQNRNTNMNIKWHQQNVNSHCYTQLCHLEGRLWNFTSISIEIHRRHVSQTTITKSQILVQLFVFAHKLLSAQCRLPDDVFIEHPTNIFYANEVPLKWWYFISLYETMESPQ